MSKYDHLELQIQQISKDNLVLRDNLIIEPHRYAPLKRSLDLLDRCLRDVNVRKIVIRKISDYKEGDIF